MPFFKELKPWQAGLGAVLLVGALQRALLWLCYPPVTYSDTGAYHRLAQAILAGWRDYDGTRPPGYPVFMALVGGDAAVYALQLLLGLAATALFFWIGWRLTGSVRFGAAAGLAHTLNAGQLFFEANLLSESLTTFWLALLLAGVVLALEKREHPRWALWLGVGLCAGLAGMTRSLFLFFPAWVVVALALFIRGWGRRLQMALAVLLPGMILLGLWVNFMNTRYGIFGVTTMTGYHLVQHTGAFFELVPEKDALLRDTFLKYRDEKIALTGTPANAIWDAIPEMMQAADLNFHSLSSQLTRISLELIAAHPDRYIASAAEGWWLFWRAPVYWKPEAFGTVQGVFFALVLAERALLFGANLLFLLTSALAVVSKRWRAWLRPTPAWVFIAASVWATSVLQTLPDHGDNPRFLIPLQTWVVLWGLWLGWRWVCTKSASQRMKH
jgi:hypothetical protein